MSNLNTGNIIDPNNPNATRSPATWAAISASSLASSLGAGSTIG